MPLPRAIHHVKVPKSYYACGVPVRMVQAINIVGAVVALLAANPSAAPLIMFACLGHVKAIKSICPPPSIAL